MTEPRWHLAQYNIARLHVPLDDARNADFVSALDSINALGESSPGFVWRHQDADGTSTGVRVRGDDAIIINYTIWESAASLFEYAYHSAHVQVFRRRREWFEEMREASLVLWWVPAGYIPSIAEADERLDYLRAHGPTEHAFTFKQRFPAPNLTPNPFPEREGELRR